ncbi:hypothetical protein GCM10011390_43570 [Aureimonas endophytica]|uniref:ElaB/YqjD/DUF883 family membrane-anchored ribosome-binding protein n=1 Tax=Aureimonas endophytica TaxID=2027858 RepID=A0A917ECM7_9HYPH|nr:hypothetical protein [Aureimonas endophytica]GGE19620.1 hypothetical protein GCM10011390_43570 [Aureimonas endophytica]
MASDVPFQNESQANASEGPKGSQEDLERQIAKLREDVAGVVEALKGLANTHRDSARQQAFALRDDLKSQGEHYLRQAQETANELEEQFSEKVRAEPVKYVLIAAAVGYVYARLFH